MTQLPDVYREDDYWVFRASSFGNCDAQLVRTALGQTPEAKPEFMETAMQHSSDHEGTIIQALQDHNGYGWKRLTQFEVPQYEWGDDGQPQVELSGPGWKIRCHPDALMQCFKAPASDDRTTERRVCEVKALKRASADLINRDSYRWQFSIEMCATKMKGLYVVGWKDDDHKLERLVDNDLDLTVALLDKPHFNLGQIKSRARALVAKIEARDLDCTYRMFPCGYWPEHDKTTGVWADQLHELEHGSAETAKYWAIRFAEAKGQEDKAKKDREAARDRLVEICRENDVPPGKVKADKATFTYVKRERAGNVDWKKVDAETKKKVDEARGKPSTSEWVEGVDIG